MIRSRCVLAAAAVLAVAVSGCTSSSDDSTSDAPSESSAATSGPASSGSSGSGSTRAGSSGTATSSAPGLSQPAQQYVSVGDSYAAGYQATGRRKGETTRNGFAYQVVTDAKAKGYRFTLTNFGCAGATTTSVLKQEGCRANLRGPGAPAYDGKTQIKAASDYLRNHRGRVGLITVSLGGNDVTACADASNTTQCLTSTLTTVSKNLTGIVSRLRSAAGPQTRIVGTTYPDVFLGDLVPGSGGNVQLASLSVLAFKSFINPALKSAYESVGGSLVDVTAATGGYGSLEKKTTLRPYGTLPVPVAQICTLTYYCEFRDIHPRTNGYAIISRLVVGTLPKR